MATFEVFLLDDKNNRLKVLSDFFRLEYAFVRNAPGGIGIVVPASRYDNDDFKRDYRLQIEKDGDIEGNTQFLIRSRKRLLNGRGEKFLQLGGFSAMSLLERRGVSYYAGSNQADRTGNADDLLKAFVRDNLGSSAQNGPHVTTVADNLRDLAAPDLSSYFTVAADTSVVASTNKAASRQPLLSILQEICDDAWQNGTFLAFDIVFNESGLLEFQTFPNQGGDDHGSTGQALVTFSPERGNLVDIERTWDWTDEVSVAIAAGQNANENRAVETQGDSDRYGASVFNWIERIIDARQTSTTAGLQAEARQGLRDGLPREILTARILDTPGTKHGEDWDTGDIVAVEFEGETVDARIDGRRVTISQGGLATTDVALRTEI